MEVAMVNISMKAMEVMGVVEVVEVVGIVRVELVELAKVMVIISTVEMAVVVEAVVIITTLLHAGGTIGPDSNLILIISDFPSTCILNSWIIIITQHDVHPRWSCQTMENASAVTQALHRRWTIIVYVHQDLHSQ